MTPFQETDYGFYDSPGFIHYQAWPPRDHALRRIGIKCGGCGLCEKPWTQETVAYEYDQYGKIPIVIGCPSADGFHFTLNPFSERGCRMCPKGFKNAYQQLLTETEAFCEV